MMIIEGGSWLHQLRRFHGTALAVVWKRVVITTAIGVAVTVFHEVQVILESNLTPLPFTIIGFALSIFLGFRNNTGYDRFWEGRKLWGAMVNVARTITRQILTMIGPRMITAGGDRRLSPAEAEELARTRVQLVHVTIAYVHAFRHHLRDQDALVELEALLPRSLYESLATELNRPVAILQWMGDRLRGLYDRGWIHPMHLPVLEASLTEITSIQGACERIKATPIPASYTVLIHRIVAIYCLGLPFGIVTTTRVMTPVVVMIVTYAFYGLDAVGSEIEDPFGLGPNHLPLTTLARMIEVNLRQRLGERELPPLLKPVNGVLY